MHLIQDLLVVRVGMHRRHQTLADTKAVLNRFYGRGQTVCGA